MTVPGPTSTSRDTVARPEPSARWSAVLSTQLLACTQMGVLQSKPVQPVYCASPSGLTKSGWPRASRKVVGVWTQVHVSGAEQ